MAHISRTLYLSAYFDKEGKFQSWDISSYKHTSEPGKYGFFVTVGEREVNFPTPDLEEVTRKALEALADAEAKLRIELQAKLIWFERARAGLRQLEHSEVLDPIEPRQPKRTPAADVVDVRGLSPDQDDDIPF